MGVQLRHSLFAIVATAAGSLAALPAAAEDATLDQGLAFTPRQPMVDYTTPAKADIPRCTMRPEKQDGAVAWILRDPKGEVLRRFADTNNDNQVDTWCYYLDGVEVYRDIDSDFNKAADQYRWFNTSGTRWGVDRNEDGQIDGWKVISPHEVAEQLVLALKNPKEKARFELLLLTPRELADLGLGTERVKTIGDSLKSASTGFTKLANEQKVVSPQTRYIDFGSSRPSTIPAGTNGSTKDVTVIDNASALIQNDSKHEQVYLGTLVSVGNTWKLIGLPMIGSENQGMGTLLAPNTTSGNMPTTTAAPTEEMQKLMNELQKLDVLAGTLPPDKQAANVDQRADLLLKLADATPDAELKGQWYRQLTDTIGAAVQSGDYAQGITKLEQLKKRLADSRADEDVISHVDFQLMWGQYVGEQRKPGADLAKVQDKWNEDLEGFVKQHPKSPDAAEALLQLGMYQELVGKSEQALTWYQQLVTGFPTADPAAKARGAVARLNAVGKPMRLKGTDVDGKPLDIAAYRGKVVLIQYWASWCGPCKEDMILLKDFHAKNAAGSKFDIVGVCIDKATPEVKSFLSKNRFPWKQVIEPGGLEGQLANEMGVMTLPLMLLVDQQGNVVNNNIHVAELDAELGKLLRSTETARK